MRKFIALVFILLVMLSNAAAVLACEPPPPSEKTFDCTDLGKAYQFGFRIDGARSGKYAFTSRYGRLIGGAPSDSNNYVRISDSNLRTFDWSASMGIDAVIIQAGGQSKVKKLNEATSGKNFQGAVDRYGKPYRVDKVYFCYDYELSVKTKAQGTATGGPAAWEITKSAASAEKAAFAGEKAVFDYTVAVQKVAGGDSSYKVNSKVTIKNNTPLTATITSVRETLNPGETNIRLDCGRAHFPYRLSSGKELTCTASTSLTSQVNGSVKAVVKTSGNVGGGSATADITWSGDAPADAAGADVDTVTVTDTNAAFGGPYSVSADQSWTYPVELACPSDPAAYTDGQHTITLDNTAAITETGQSASQSVTLQCYAPTVSTSASASYDVQYLWDITKTSPVTELELQENESADVDYVATVSVAGMTQSNVRVAGFITIGNPHPDAPLTAELVDEMAPGVPAPLSDCTSPVTVPAGETVTCNFEAAMDTAPAGANNVQVVFNGITFTATAPFDETGKNETDECVTVYDSAFEEEPLGVVCADSAPVTFPYSVTVGPYDQCQETSYINSAWFITNDTEAFDYANWEVLIDVQCEIITDCVRTIQYWLNHANPADTINFNPTWNLVSPSGSTSPFFTSGFSWIEMLGSDASSSAYRRLAQTYIAARLNTLYGAIANAAVSAKIDQAEVLLAQYATTQGEVIGTVAQEFQAAEAVLSNFNRGVMGPNICVDCND